MINEKNKMILAVAAIIVVLVAAAATGFHLITLQSAPRPINSDLTAYPNNATVMQNQNTTIKVDVAYLEGTPELVTVSASGGPNGTLYQFNSETGTPNASQSFSSNLTIVLPASAASDTYAINISSTLGSRAVQTTFHLTVINSQIQVSGTVTGTPMPLAGYASEDIVPTQIVFENTKTNQTYQAKVYRATDTPQRPGTVGNYSILLPNRQSYRVTIYYFSFPHFVPVARAAYEGNQRGHFTVDCGAGIDTIVADFQG
jgi:hypothetical protein